MELWPAGATLTILTPQAVVARAAVGLYATFHDEAETAHSPTSTLGPFDEITIRSAHVVGEHGQLGTVIAAHGANGRWRAADPELQRSLETVRGDASRAHIRVYTEGCDLRLRVFDDEPEHSASVAELGPFSVVDVGTYALRADLLIVAVRVTTMGAWLLTDNAGNELAGIAKRVLALRAGSARRAAALALPVPVETLTPPEASPVAIDVAAPFVWIDRARPAQEIYISRPDVPRRRDP